MSLQCSKISRRMRRGISLNSCESLVVVVAMKVVT